MIHYKKILLICLFLLSFFTGAIYSQGVGDRNPIVRRYNLADSLAFYGSKLWIQSIVFDTDSGGFSSYLEMPKSNPAFPVGSNFGVSTAPWRTKSYSEFWDILNVVDTVKKYQDSILAQIATDISSIQLRNLEDVSAATPNTGDILVYDAITGFWNSQANTGAVLPDSVIFYEELKVDNIKEVREYEPAIIDGDAIVFRDGKWVIQNIPTMIDTSGSGKDLEPELVVTPAESKIVADVDSFRVAGNFEVDDTLKVSEIGNVSDLELYAKNLQINLTDSTSKFFLTIADENAGNNIVPYGTFDNDLTGWDATGTPSTFEWVPSGGGFTGAAHLITNEDYEDIHLSPAIIVSQAAGRYRIKIDINIVSITGDAELVRYMTVSPMIIGDEYYMSTTGLYSIDTVLMKPNNISSMLIDIGIYQLGAGTVEFYVDNVLVQPQFGTSLSITLDDGINIESLNDITIRTDDILNLYGTVLVNGFPLSTGGSVGNADSLGGIPAIQYALDVDVDSMLKLSGPTYKLSHSGPTIDSWLGGLNTWTSGLNSTSNLLKLGLTNRQIYFNNGAYSDFWLLNYVIHPYNLPYANQIMHEFRTDYYNDTLKTFQSIAGLTYLDGTGSYRWHPDGFSYIHNQNALGVGDLPDSITAVFNGGGTVGVQFQISEVNKTAGAKRFPMKVKGFEFKFGSTPYYTYPYVYGYYSDLTTNTPKLEKAWHFYGQGDYPSYLGGDLQVAGEITSGIAITYPDAKTIQFGGDAILLDPATLEIQTGILTVVGGTGGGIDTTIFNDLFNTAIDTMVSDTSIHTMAEIDTVTARGLRGDYDGVGSLPDSIVYASELTAGLATKANTSHSHTISNVTGLQDSLTALRNYIANILDLISGCCDLSDNTPPAKPTSLVATPSTAANHVLTWTDPTAFDLDSIRIYRGSSNDTTALTTFVGRAIAGAETYTWTGGSEGATYWWGIKAVDDSGNVSSWSNTDSSKFTSGGATPFATLDFEEGNLTDWSTTGANADTSKGTGAYAGTYGMKITSSSGTLSFKTFTARDSVYVQFRIKVPSSTTFTDGYVYCCFFSPSNGDDHSYFGGDATIAAGYHWETWLAGQTSGSMEGFTTNFSLGVWHQITLLYKKGTGANSRHRMWVDGTLTMNVITGTHTEQMDRFQLGIQVETATGNMYYDDIKFYDENPLGY